MASECELNLHMTPLQASQRAQELAASGVKLPNWIQHWALLFLWKDTDRALRVEGVEHNGKCIVIVTPMSFHDGERQAGTKVQCGTYQLSYEQVKSAATKIGADPPDYHQITANCQTTAKQILEELGISVNVLTVLGEVLKLATVIGGPEAAAQLKADILNAAAEQEAQ